jgi:hypothetical protein
MKNLHAKNGFGVLLDENIRSGRTGTRLRNPVTLFVSSILLASIVCLVPTTSVMAANIWANIWRHSNHL